MTNDTISRRGLMQAIRTEKCLVFNGIVYIPETELCAALDKSVIDASPIINMEPIVHAKWESVEKEAFWLGDSYIWGKTGKPTKQIMPRCSNCKTEYGRLAYTFKQCPECGAHMDLESEGTDE